MKNTKPTRNTRNNSKPKSAKKPRPVAARIVKRDLRTPLTDDDRCAILADLLNLAGRDFSESRLEEIGDTYSRLMALLGL